MSPRRQQGDIANTLKLLDKLVVSPMSPDPSLGHGDRTTLRLYFGGSSATTYSSVAPGSGTQTKPCPMAISPRFSSALRVFQKAVSGFLLPTIPASMARWRHPSRRTPRNPRGASHSAGSSTPPSLIMVPSSVSARSAAVPPRDRFSPSSPVPAARSLLPHRTVNVLTLVN